MEKIDLQQKTSSIISFWTPPWGWATSFFIHTSFLSIGAILDLFGPHTIPPFPYNLALLMIYLTIVCLLYLIKSFCYPVKWLLTSYGAISSILSFVFLLFLFELGVFKNLFTSWPFLFSWFFMTTSLGLVIIRQFFLQEKINLILAHLGTFMIIISMTFGSGDYQNFQMVLEEGHVVGLGIQEGRFYQTELPFALKLHYFEKRDYPPNVFFFDTLSQQKRDSGHWKIRVLETINSAFFLKNRFVRTKDIGGVVASYIEATHKKTGEIKKGYISTASLRQDSKKLFLTPTLFVSYEMPRPKFFESRLDLYTPNGELVKNISLRVNHPYKFGLWTLYQSGYDDQQGVGKVQSMISAVYDPWIGGVWGGLSFLFVGIVFYLFQRIREVGDAL